MLRELKLKPQESYNDFHRVKIEVKITRMSKIEFHKIRVSNLKEEQDEARKWGMNGNAYDQGERKIRQQGNLSNMSRCETKRVES